MATKISATNIMPAHAFGPYEAYAGLTEAQKGQFIHFNTDPEDSEFSGTIAFRGFLFGKGRIPTAVTNMGDGTIKITMKGTDDIVSTSLKASKTTFGFVKTTDSISEANNDVSLVPTYSVVYALYQDKAPKANPVFTGVPQAPTPTSDTTLTQIATIEYVRNKIAANDAMRYCGTLGTGGDVSELPSISLDTVKNGDKYVVASAGTYNGIPCKVGDSFIANKINNNIADKWNYIPSANENETLLHYTTSPSAVTLTTTSKYGTIILGSAATKIAAISGNTSASNSDEYVPTVKYLENSVATLRNDEILTKVGSISSTTLEASAGTKGQAGTPYSIELKEINTTQGSVGLTSAISPGFGEKITIFSGTTDKYGRVTNNGSFDITLPSAVASNTKNGLMSATDKANLDAIVAGCVWYETSIS